MTKKSMVFATVLAMSSAVLAAGLAAYGGYLLTPSANAESNTDLLADGENRAILTEAEIHFVDVKNIVITLTRNGRANHYLLLDLAVTTNSSEQVDKVKNSMALIKSSTVNLLTNMDYDSLSKMHVSDLRQQLLDEYRKAYTSLNMNAPFNDVMISKMVFQ